MKKKLSFILLILSVLCSGCSETLPESSVELSEIPESSVVSETAVSETSFVTFPKGVSTYSLGKLKYTDGSISVIFTDEFYISDNRYQPENGVYLHNDTGTATLLIETVSDNTVTNEEMLAYLYETYPYSEISSAENNDIICQYTLNDKTNHTIITFQKIRLYESGYRQISLTCRPSDKDKYQKIFNGIQFS